MTYMNIIKAMECCAEDKCSECPLSDETCSEKDVIKEALALITRQRNEIDRYKSNIKILESDVVSAREESIREFSRLLIDKIDSGLITNSSDIEDFVDDYLE